MTKSSSGSMFIKKIWTPLHYYGGPFVSGWVYINFNSFLLNMEWGSVFIGPGVNEYRPPDRF